MTKSKSTSPYEMRLDLRVLDHLGINLYSNAAAVLSEAVANAWDADADRVSITVAKERIAIEDDGEGMDLEAVNKRFLSVGYDKRAEEGDVSRRQRRYMGRKGIGKLALFSIADVIDVHTTKGKERHAFRMDTADLRAAIEKGNTYYPAPLGYDGTARGTRIVLSRLKKKRTASVGALRKRIARRFSIIGTRPNGDTFSVVLNGDPVGKDDREDLKSVEFLWEFGERRINPNDCLALKDSFVLKAKVSPDDPAWTVGGWIGAVAEPTRLTHADAGSLHGIVVLARGRLIQENILQHLNYSRILVSYITGQVEADFLDLKDADDIATSDRQRLIEDDERYVALKTFLREALVSIQDQWTSLRNEVRGKEAIREHPALGDWIADLPKTQQKPAARLLGMIRGMQLEKEDDRRQLYRSGMMAFERLRLREEAHKLDVEGLTAELLLPLLADLDALEGSLYREIVKGRLAVLKSFEGLVNQNEKEKVLQRHLFENLWLLDTGWDRATEGSASIERKLKKEYSAFKPNLTDKQSKGRVDIKYRTNAGEHIVVELKRARVRLHMHEVVEQAGKYETGLRKCLEAAGYKNPHISVVVVVGQPLYDEDDPGGTERVTKNLATLNTRVIRYEMLIEHARDQYAAYLAASAKTDRLDEILKKV